MGKGKDKDGICMADGGITRQETADELMARMTAKYGAPAAGPVPQQPAPVAQTQPQPKPAPTQPASSVQGALGILRGRKEAIDKATNFANGGIVRGKGTPTSDDVPVKIKGKDYNLSDTEAVLPSKTRQALGEMLGARPGDVAQANALVEKFIEQTNGKPPVSVEEGTNLADGGLLDEEAGKMNYQAVTGVSAPAPTPAPAPVQAQTTPGISLGRSPAPTIYDNGGLPAGVVQRGIDTMKSQLATPAEQAAARAPGSSSNYVGNGPTDPDVNGRNAVPAGVQRGIATMRSQMNPNPSGPFAENAANSAAAESHLQSLYPSGTFDSQQKQASVGVGPGYTVTNDVAGAAKIRSAHQSILDGSPSSAGAQSAANANEAGLSGRQGAYMVENNLRSFEDKGGGIVRQVGANGSRTFTNVGTENVTDPNKKVQVNSYNGAADNESVAKANSIRQSIIDKQPVGGVGILGDGGVGALNDERTARWRQDELLSAAKYGNRAAGDAIQANAHLGVEGIRSATAQRGQDVGAGITARGQDLTANTEANRLAVESPLKQAQTQGIMAQNESASTIAEIQKKALAGDQQAIATLNSLRGKGQSASDRFLTVPGGEEVGPDGMTKIKKPSGVFDAQTQKFVSMDGGQAGQVQAPAAAIDYLKKNPNQAAAFKAKYGYLPEGF
jgi:hypothetical protein